MTTTRQIRESLASAELETSIRAMIERAEAAQAPDLCLDHLWAALDAARTAPRIAAARVRQARYLVGRGVDPAAAVALSRALQP